jgi:hypothetical protein
MVEKFNGFQKYQIEKECEAGSGEGQIIRSPEELDCSARAIGANAQVDCEHFFPPQEAGGFGTDPGPATLATVVRRHQTNVMARKLPLEKLVAVQRGVSFISLLSSCKIEVSIDIAGQATYPPPQAHRDNEGNTRHLVYVT